MSAATVRRVAIVGAESSGKSTLARALAAHYRTVWVPEYLRDFVEQQQRVPFEHEQIHIAHTQAAREDLALADGGARQYVFCDTTPMMTAIYSHYCFGRVDAPLDALARTRHYDAMLLTAPDFPWVADGLQRDSDAARQAIHALVVRQLADLGMAYLLVEGPLERRVESAVDYLARRLP